MSLASPPDSSTAAPAHPHRRTKRWIEEWNPEDEAFWESGGSQIARRNLIWSIFSEHLGFSVWLIWSVSSAFLVAQGFDFTAQQLFFMVAIPNLIGSLLRVPYTLMVGKIGGRNWTMISASLLLVPTLTFAWAVTNPSTPYWAFCLIAATAGLGGGNFSSSMANINFFYPASKKGAALGLNAAGGNVGVAFIQFFLPIIVGGAGIFGIVKASDGGIHLERAAWVYAGLAVVATLAAYFFMDNLGTAKTDTKSQLAVLKKKQTWIMAFLYVGTFGSFIGYSAAMPLLIKINFWVPEPAPLGTGVFFAYYAFLGALVGSFTRPFGGWLADKYGGAKITLISFGGLITFTAAVLWTLTQLTPNPNKEVAIAAENEAWFPLFLAFFLLVFAFTGIGNGSVYKMIPAVFKTEASRVGEHGSPERASALVNATKRASAAIGIIGAAGAVGGFLIPITFASPFISAPMEATKIAFFIFTAFYGVCAVVTWAVYLRKPHPARAHVSYANAGI
ncbi:nitrate/nitrite transporter [Nocardioides sp. YIM 152588]|uniref:nitrate/nitrite transporter n=1 Tax=Nocardioides sp. YIM 152588 TaxID=3158259 RepID=UPI0032E42F62